MSDTPETEDPFADRRQQLSIIATVLLAARVIALRGQPANHGDVVEAVSNADALIKEVERRCGGG